MKKDIKELCLLDCLEHICAGPVVLVSIKLCLSERRFTWADGHQHQMWFPVDWSNSSSSIRLSEHLHLVQGKQTFSAVEAMFYSLKLPCLLQHQIQVDYVWNVMQMVPAHVCLCAPLVLIPVAMLDVFFVSVLGLVLIHTPANVINSLKEN